MTRARQELVNAGRPGCYHIITRCVRRERLLDRGDRKSWMCAGLAEWLQHMAIDLLAYSVMGNHVHLVVRLRPDVASTWTPADVARHALAVLPVRSGPGLEPLVVTPAVVERYAENARWVSEQRKRLSSPSWLMRLIKQGIARRANAEDDCNGHFWEKRFSTVALLDAAGVLACMVYVDLNPYRARLVTDPVDSLFTSIRHRCARANGKGRADQASDDDALGRRLEPMPKCAPHEDWSGKASTWSISEGDYVALVQETASLANRHGRGAVASALAALRRFDIEPSAWIACMSSGGSMAGCAIGGPEARERWCRKVDQRWAADKTGLWD